MATLSVEYDGCTTFESGPWTKSNLCFNFSCVEKVDGSTDCQCNSATFNDRSCAQCDFRDVGKGGVPRVDCGDVDGPNTIDLDACVTDLDDPVAPPVAAPDETSVPVAAPETAPTIGGDDGAPTAGEIETPPTSAGLYSAVSSVCAGFGYVLLARLVM